MTNVSPCHCGHMTAEVVTENRVTKSVKQRLLQQILICWVEAFWFLTVKTWRKCDRLELMNTSDTFLHIL